MLEVLKNRFDFHTKTMFLPNSPDNISRFIIFMSRKTCLSTFSIFVPLCTSLFCLIYAFFIRQYWSIVRCVQQQYRANNWKSVVFLNNHYLAQNIFLQRLSPVWRVEPTLCVIYITMKTCWKQVLTYCLFSVSLIVTMNKTSPAIV